MCLTRTCRLPRVHIRTLFVTATHVLCTLVGTAAAQTQADTTPASADQQMVDRWMQIYDKAADSVQLDHGDGVKKNSLKRSKILTIVNAQLGGRHGQVYLWTDEERPVAIASFMSSAAKNIPLHRWVNYEFHSLSQAPVQVKKAGKVIWRCKKPGIAWLELEDSITPAASAARRLVQMRSIARSIEANGRSDRFRLLTQPIYRYAAPEKGVTDGALFSYSKSTDPCVYLLVEFRKEKCFIAFARSNHHELKIKRKNEELWSFVQKKTPDPGPVQDEPFYLYWFGELRHNDTPETIVRSAYK